MFELHPQLAADTVKIGEFELCDVLLMNESSYPWVILVPRRNDISEIHQLSQSDQQQLARESSFLAGKMHINFQADKMNVAALGNMVPQLHIHHIARYQSDSAWPKPIWGVNPVVPYGEDELEISVSSLQALLSEKLI